MSGALAPEDAARYGFHPDPADDRWLVREATSGAGFVDVFGAMRVTAEGEGRARCRFAADESHRNLHGDVHGGMLMAIIDQAIFLGPIALGLPAIGGSTVEVSTHFARPTRIGTAIDALVEVVRETGRHIFVRGTIEQAGEITLFFSALLLKPR